MRAVKGHEVKKGGWGQLKAFGLYSRGSEVPPKIVGKLDMFKNARRTRDQPHLGGGGCCEPLSPVEGPHLAAGPWQSWAVEGKRTPWCFLLHWQKLIALPGDSPQRGRL